MPDELRLALVRGCLAGLGLAGVFFLVSAILYIAARSFGMEQGPALVVAIAGGPVIVSVVVLGGIVARARSRARSDAALDNFQDATTTWDDA